MSGALLSLHIVALAPSSSHPEHFALVLEDTAAIRRLPVILSATAAKVIAATLEGVPRARPCTYDVFVSLITALGAQLLSVELTSWYDNITSKQLLGAALTIRDRVGEKHTLEARASDGIVLAVCTDCALLIRGSLLDHLSVAFSESSQHLDYRHTNLHNYSIAQLNILLGQCLANEDYATAATIQAVLDYKRCQR